MYKIGRSLVENHHLDSSAQGLFQLPLERGSQILEPAWKRSVQQNSYINIAFGGCGIPRDAAEEVGGNEVRPRCREYFHDAFFDLLPVHEAIISRNAEFPFAAFWKRLR